MSQRPATHLRLRGRVLDLRERTLVMGVLNVTPDSFSGDGIAGDVDAAVRRGVDLAADGADIIDVGGESTRPHAARVPADTELVRVVPVIERLVERVDVPISVDTRKPAVARACIEAGAAMVNDVWGLRGDPDMAAAVTSRDDVGLVVMHNQHGTAYADLGAAILAALSESMQLARGAGIAAERIVVDPGFGFGKTPAHNLELMRRLPELLELGRPILVGASRKSTIGALTGGRPPQDRLEGGIALAVLAVAAGVHMIRTHDVAATRRAVEVADAVVRGTPPHIADLPAPGPTG
jgi:dihydropteroate synthase